MDDNAAYMITHVKVKDEEKWDEYRSQVPATLSEWSAEVVFRGKRAEVLTSEHEYTHMSLPHADPSDSSAMYLGL